jgi:hypothetical protein
MTISQSDNDPTSLSLSRLQSTDIEFRHELMNRLNKLDTDVELEILPSQQNNNSVSPSSSTAVYGSYESYGNVKEYYCGKSYHTSSHTL